MLVLVQAVRLPWLYALTRAVPSRAEPSANVARYVNRSTSLIAAVAWYENESLLLSRSAVPFVGNVTRSKMKLSPGLAPSTNGVTGVLRRVSGAVRPARVAVNRVLSGSRVNAVLCAVPRELVSVIGPDAASSGTLTVTCDAFAAITAAWAGVPSAPANATWLFAGTGSKNAPVNVTSVPAEPFSGATESITGGLSRPETARLRRVPARPRITTISSFPA